MTVLWWFIDARKGALEQPRRGDAPALPVLQLRPPAQEPQEPLPSDPGDGGWRQRPRLDACGDGGSPKLTCMEISFGDHVRIVAAPVTEECGYAGAFGQVYGITTPSVTGVAVVGESDEDVAYNVQFEAPDLEGAWFAPRLVEFVDHAPGTDARIGDRRFIRRPDGGWDPVE